LTPEPLKIKRTEHKGQTSQLSSLFFDTAKVFQLLHGHLCDTFRTTSTSYNTTQHNTYISCHQQTINSLRSWNSNCTENSKARNNFVLEFTRPPRGLVTGAAGSFFVIGLLLSTVCVFLNLFLLNP
jgi:hypothetical protein